MVIKGPTHLYHPDYEGYREVKTQAQYDALIDDDDRWRDEPYPEEVEGEVKEEEQKPPAPTLKLKPGKKVTKKKGR